MKLKITRQPVLGLTFTVCSFKFYFRSMRSTYINSAIGWVQVKRERHVCTVRAKMCPEQKVNATLYVVESRIFVYSCWVKKKRMENELVRITYN